MGLAEIRALKKMEGFYEGEKATDKVLASMKPKVKKPIPKQSAKKKEANREQSLLMEMDRAFYAEIWESCPHKCEACKLKLGKEPLTIFFHHALSKAKYPAFRHEHGNIIILCPSCHSQVEGGKTIPYVKKRTEQIRNELLKG